MPFIQITKTNLSVVVLSIPFYLHPSFLPIITNTLYLTFFWDFMFENLINPLRLFIEVNNIEPISAVGREIVQQTRKAVGSSPTRIVYLWKVKCMKLIKSMSIYLIYLMNFLFILFYSSFTRKRTRLVGPCSTCSRLWYT